MSYILCDWRYQPRDIDRRSPCSAKSVVAIVHRCYSLGPHFFSDLLRARAADLAQN